MSNSFISGQPSVQGEDGAQNSIEQQQPTDLHEYSWNLIKVNMEKYFNLIRHGYEFVLKYADKCIICGLENVK